MPFLDFSKILIEKGAESHPVTANVLQALPGTAVEWVDPASLGRLNVSRIRSKRTILLTRFKGALIKPCPGTQGYICCGYRILHVGTNCPLDCSYCILQAYFNQPFIRVFVNTDEIFRHLRELDGRSSGEPIRLGTGEFTDSLALDPLTGFSALLHNELEECPGVIVELKTKTAQVDHLLRLPPSSRIIVSWSLNPSEIVRREERGAASLEARLQAASRCQERGYLLGFHFDPIFYFPGWERAYERTVRALFSKVRPEGIAWISLGCFRYLPALRAVILERHLRAAYLHQEFIPALDKKMRYPQSLRVEIYRRMVGWLRRYGEDPFLYLCMENASIWEQVFGYVPGRDGPTLKAMLDQRVRDMRAENERVKKPAGSGIGG